MSFIRKSISLICLIFIFSLLSIQTHAERKGYWVHLVNYANPISLEQIKNRYSAFDTTDGNLTNKIHFQTNYDENNLEIGEYELLVTVTNKKKKTTSQTDIILVRDFICPTIMSYSQNLTIDVGKTTFLEGLTTNLIIKDNLDNLDYSNLIIEGIDINNIIVGEYEITLYCIDNSTNKSNKISLNVTIINSLDTINYVLTTYEKLSKDEVIQILIEDSIIRENFKEISIKSDYFNLEPNYGKYQAYINIKYQDEEKNYSFIIDYRDEKDSFNQDLTLMIIGFILTIEVLIYIKRH